MEIRINRPKCAGHALCTILAPDVFDLDGEGKAVVSRTAARSPAADIREAADACPALAITLTAEA